MRSLLRAPKSPSRPQYLVVRTAAAMSEAGLLRQQKALLRKTINSRIQALDSSSIAEQSNEIARKVLDMDEYRSARAISIFLSMPGKEVSTREILLDAFRQDKTVFVPYIYSSHNPAHAKSMAMLELRDEDDLNALQPDAWGIPSLDSNSVPSRRNALGGSGPEKDQSKPTHEFPSLDVIFMPAVAFDNSRRRLGHGKGFYDRYLHEYQEASTRMKRGARPWLVGLALREQMLPSSESVPTDDGDWSVDIVVTSNDVK